MFLLSDTLHAIVNAMCYRNFRRNRHAYTSVYCSWSGHKIRGKDNSFNEKFDFSSVWGSGPYPSNKNKIWSVRLVQFWLYPSCYNIKCMRLVMLWLLYFMFTFCGSIQLQRSKKITSNLWRDTGHCSISNVGNDLRPRCWLANFCHQMSLDTLIIVTYWKLFFLGCSEYGCRTVDYQ